MLRQVFAASFAMLLLGACGSASIWVSRKSLPYNSEGRYLDPEHGVVYHEQVLVASGLLTALFVLLAIICWMISRKF